MYATKNNSMSNDIKDINDELEVSDALTEAHSNYVPADGKNEEIRHHLTGMFQNWFLDYASYVILERAVPHVDDGLKPALFGCILKSMDFPTG